MATLDYGAAWNKPVDDTAHYPSLFVGALSTDEFRITILTRTRYMCVILKTGMQPMLRDESRVATAAAHRKTFKEIKL